MASHHEELIPTRASLLNRLKNWEDQSSWQDFFDSYWKLIYGVARKAGLTDPEAQDVVQETMISVAKHIPKFQYDPALGSFKRWLLNMTRWRIIGQFRKRAALPTAYPSSDDDGTRTESIQKIADPAGQVLDAIWEAEWEQSLLDAAVSKVKRRLDPAKYQIFDFYVNKGWPAEKVTAQFGVPIEQVYLTKHRVTELIKEEVKRLSKEL